MGFSGAITLVDRQSGIPLERPPLSKSYLGSMPEDDEKFLLRRPEWYDKFQVTMIDGLAVERIDSELHQVWLADGQLLNYDKLSCHWSGAARTASSGSRKCACFVKPDDAAALRRAINSKYSRIIGGGYIGLEAA